MVEQNENLLWLVYLFYSFNAAYFKDSTLGQATPSKPTKLKPMPVFKTAAKYEKRLLHQDDLWQLLNDFALVPAVVNTIRFNKILR